MNDPFRTGLQYQWSAFEKGPRVAVLQAIILILFIIVYIPKHTVNDDGTVLNNCEVLVSYLSILFLCYEILLLQYILEAYIEFFT